MINRKKSNEQGRNAGKKREKTGLTTKIFIALIGGMILGSILHSFVPSSYWKDTVLTGGIFYVVGQGFIRLMQMLVVPLVFCSIVCGSAAIGDTKTLGKVGVKILAFYLVTTAMAISVALALGTIVKPGLQLDLSKVTTAASNTSVQEPTSMIDTLLNIIPTNPIQALANGEMLQIILFAVIVGIILAKLGEKTEVVFNFFSGSFTSCQCG